MSTELHNITIRIMNREIKVQCPKDKIKELQESATYLEAKMADLVANDKAFNLEKVAIVSALNIVRELMATKRQGEAHLHIITHRLRELKDKIQRKLAAEI